MFRYHLRKEQLIEESRKEEEDAEFRAQQAHNFGDSYFAIKRRKLWDLVEKPNSSPYAKVSTQLKPTTLTDKSEDAVDSQVDQTYSPCYDHSMIILCSWSFHDHDRAKPTMATMFHSMMILWSSCFIVWSIMFHSMNIAWS